MRHGNRRRVSNCCNRDIGLQIVSISYAVALKIIQQKAASTMLKPSGFPIVKRTSNRSLHRMAQKDTTRGKAWLVSENCYNRLKWLAIQEKIK